MTGQMNSFFELEPGGHSNGHGSAGESGKPMIGRWPLLFDRPKEKHLPFPVSSKESPKRKENKRKETRRNNKRTRCGKCKVANASSPVLVCQANAINVRTKTSRESRDRE